MCRFYENKSSRQEELYQDILTAIYLSLESFKGDSSIHTWAFRVALNTSLKHRDRKKFDELLDLDSDVDLVPTDSSIEAKIDFNIMIDFASTFKPIDRELIYMYLIGVSQDEIAEVLGLTVHNVSTKISRLKIKIINYLNKGSDHANQ